MKWFHFIFSHSIFISICAAALCYQTYLLLALPVDNTVLMLAFTATLTSYNLYWLISKFHFGNRQLSIFLKQNFSNVLLFALASVATLICVYRIPQLLPYIFIAVFLTLLYSLPLWPFRQLLFLRRAGFLKTSLLAFTWTYVTVVLPVVAAPFTPDIKVTILFIARFSFMILLCTIFDARDKNIDKLHGLSSLATQVSNKTLNTLMTFFFCMYIIAGFLLRFTFTSNAQVMAFLITGLLVFLVYQLSLKKQGYIFYYFIVDGLMLFSAAATYMASI